MNETLSITVNATLEHGTHETKCVVTYTKNAYKSTMFQSAT